MASQLASSYFHFPLGVDKGAYLCSPVPKLPERMFPAIYLPRFGTSIVIKGSVYIAQYAVRWTAQSALHFLPSLADLFIPTPTRLLREAF